jgi:hypothetical protein
MKKFFQILTLLFLTACCETLNSKNNLEQEMARLGVGTALIVQSQAIDEYPLWAPDSSAVAVNVMGKWRKFDLKNVGLAEADWHKQKIGVLMLANEAPEILDSEKERLLTSSKYDPREILTQKGDKVELSLDGFSTSLIVTEREGQSKVLWRSGMENCHSLALSPNEKYLAYLCELNGLFVMRLE